MKSVPILIPSVFMVLSACALAGRTPNHASDVRIEVRNRSTRAVQVRVCADECSEYRHVDGGGRERFAFAPRRNTRAVVTAKRGDRVIDQKPVDFEPGDRIQVVFDVP
jgi:hypothetical protein